MLAVAAVMAAMNYEREEEGRCVVFEKEDARGISFHYTNVLLLIF